ncbi:hypothetical protein AVEN_265975-1 [Araneus ventricosus]|uniref:Uncharacterized protein n=1 Tax=Araneus ventricosus TaxID=182803 RepID=A0A4Y2GKK5_ARAVE|nr:hypothetical protein AVEN_265975-1 [Araneus ventricosus]
MNISNLNLESRGDFFLLTPLKPGLFGRKRHELDSPNLGGHFLLHSPFYNLPLRRTEMCCGGQGQLDPLPRSSPKRSRNLLSKEANRLIPAFVAVKGEFLDRPGTPRSV